MNKIRYIFSWVLFCACCFSVVLNVSANSPLATYTIPQKLKVGSNLYISENDKFPEVKGQNLPVGEYFYIETDFYNACTISPRGNPPDPIGADKTSTEKIYVYKAYMPGKYYMQAVINSDIYSNDGIKKNIGEKYIIEVEQPIIAHNAPEYVKVGSKINLKTSLTNTALKDKKVSKYVEGEIAYQPNVTIIEGKDIIETSNQDYSNILGTSESLSFKKTGVIKIKVIYNQIDTGFISSAETEDEKYYNPEKIIIIQVTEDGKKPTNITTTSSNITTTKGSTTTSTISKNSTHTTTIPKIIPPEVTNTNSLTTIENTYNSVIEKPIVFLDEKTGIKIHAEDGVIPQGTILLTKTLTDGELFKNAQSLLINKSSKISIYDISLERSKTKIQPNGKVLVSIPMPMNYDKSKLIVYYLNESNELTRLEHSVNDTDVVFETEHFSTYILAENIALEVNNNTKVKNGFWKPWLIIFLGILIVLLVLVLYLIKVKKYLKNS